MSGQRVGQRAAPVAPCSRKHNHLSCDDFRSDDRVSLEEIRVRVHDIGARPAADSFLCELVMPLSATIADFRSALAIQCCPIKSQRFVNEGVRVRDHDSIHNLLQRGNARREEPGCAMDRTDSVPQPPILTLFAAPSLVGGGFGGGCPYSKPSASEDATDHGADGQAGTTQAPNSLGRADTERTNQMNQAYREGGRRTSVAMPKFETGRYNNESQEQFNKRKADEKAREVEQQNDIERRRKAKIQAGQTMLDDSRALGNKYMKRLATLVPNDPAEPVSDLVQAYKCMCYCRAAFELLHAKGSSSQEQLDDLQRIAQRIEDSAGGSSEHSKAIDSMWRQVGWEHPRNERERWSSRLEEELQAVMKRRETAELEGVLRGDMQAATAGTVARTMVRYLLSSTFTDTSVERNLLMDDVTPYLQEYARRRGFECVTTEMRWGIRSEASADHQTSEICMQELERCITESGGMNYILIAGQKYGFRPPPNKIKESEFDALLQKVQRGSDRELLRETYQLDTNNEGENQYVMQSRSYGADSDWNDKFTRMQTALREAARSLWADHLPELRKPHSKHPIKWYFFSVTEEEVSRGLFWRDDRDRRAYVFKREIQGLEELARRGSGPQVADYIDMADEKVDAEAVQLLKEQQEAMIPAVLGSARMKKYAPLQWGPGISSEDPGHQVYLREFADDFCDVMLQSIDDAVAQAAIEPDPVADEARDHLRFASQRAEHFTSTTAATEVTQQIARYLSEQQDPLLPHNKRAAFVVWGPSGVGKTYVMCRAVNEASDKCNGDTRTVNGSVVVRFLGTTPDSSNVQALLKSLCMQLSRLYPQDNAEAEELLPTDFKELCTLFRRQLVEWVTPEQPLYLFLDSIDQLDDSNAGRRLEWLPVRELPPHVRIVISTLPDDGSKDAKFQCLSLLHRRLHEVAPMNFIGVQPCFADGDTVLQHLMRKNGRTLTAVQRQAIMDGFNRAGTPLWLTIAAQWAHSWKSFQVWDNQPIPPIAHTVSGLIYQLFDRLESDHGKFLTAAALAYVTLARHGVSVTELQELLSLEDDVLADSYQWWVPPVRIIPPLLPTRLLSDLSDYLSRRGDGSGVQLVCWYHRQFWETAEGTYVPDEETRVQRHKEMVDYFSGKWAGVEKPYNEWLSERVQRPEFFPGETQGDRRVPQQQLVLFGTLGLPGSRVNVRRVRELVHHLINAGEGQAAWRELTSMEYITAKFEAGAGNTLLGELARARTKFPEYTTDLEQVKSFIGRRLDRLLRPAAPNAVFQLAIQEPDTSLVCIDGQKPQAEELRQRVIRWRNKPRELEPCVLTIKEHEGRVNSVAWSPDKSYVASASDDNTIKICDASTGEETCTLDGHRDPVTCLAYNHDGTILASSSWDKSVRLWDPKTGRLAEGVRNKLVGHLAAINSVAFNKEGTLLASASGSPGCDDNTIRIWDAKTGEEVCVMYGHTGTVFCLAFNRDGTTLASGGTDCAVRLWDLETFREEENQLPVVHKGTVHAVAWHPTKEILASGSRDNGIVLWDPAAGEPLQQMRGLSVRHSNGVTSLCFEPTTGELLASGGGDNNVRFWSTQTGLAVGSVLAGHKHPVACIAFAPDGKNLASGSDDATVRLWLASHVDTAAAREAVTDGNEIGNGNGIGLQPEPAEAALAGAEEQLEGGLRGELKQGGAIDPYNDLDGAGGTEQGESVLSVAFSPDGTLLGSASGNAFGGGKDSCIRMRGLGPDGVERVLRGHERAVNSIAFSPDGKLLASGSWDNTLRLWDVASARLLIPPMRGHEDAVTSVAFSPGGKVLASGSDDRTIRLWSPETGQSLVSPLARHSDWVRSVTFSPDGTILASGSDDRSVLLWDTKTGQPSTQQALTGHANPVTSVAISPNGDRLASGSWDKTILLWDLAKPNEHVGKLVGHSGPVYKVHFFSQHLLLSVSDDSTLRIWDLRTGGETPPCISAFYAPLPLKCVHSHDRSIAVGDEKGIVHLLDVPWKDDVAVSPLRPNRRRSQQDTDN